MNAENFSEIIKNPSQLYQIPYQELKSLVLQYPYCRNLHHLLLTKVLQANHAEQQRAFDAILEKTATLSIDRKFLYQQMRTLREDAKESESFELGEEYLELHDLSTLGTKSPPLPVEALRPEEKEIDGGTQGHATGPLDELLPAEKTSPIATEEDLFDFESVLDAPLPPEDILPSKEDLDANMENEKTPLPSEDTTPFYPDAQLLSDCAALLGILESQVRPEKMSPPADTLSDTTPFQPDLTLIEAAVALSQAIEELHKATDEKRTPEKTTDKMTPASPPRPAPKPKSSFKSWVKQFQPSHIQPHLDELMESGKSGKKKRKKKKKDKITTFAEQSLLENEEVATETLAELLVQQERYSKAIRVYDRLRLIFPEKSSFFAEKIEQLKKQL